MFGPPLEGFHRGATCVVTPVTGSEEYVEHGFNGLLTDWDDLAGTARQLDLLARDRELLHFLRTNALETARAWPYWEQSSQFMAAALLAIQRGPPPAAAAAGGSPDGGPACGHRGLHPSPARAPRLRTARDRGSNAGSSACGRQQAGARGAVVAALPRRTDGREAVSPVDASHSPGPPVSSRRRGRSWRELTRDADRKNRRRPAAHGSRCAPRAESVRHRPRCRPSASIRTRPLRVATVIPSFRRGSGGHATIVNLMRELRAPRAPSLAVARGLRRAPRP